MERLLVRRVLHLRRHLSAVTALTGIICPIPLKSATAVTTATPVPTSTYASQRANARARRPRAAASRAYRACPATTPTDFATSTSLPADAAFAKRASRPRSTPTPNAMPGDAAAKDLQITLEKQSIGDAPETERAMNMLIKRMSDLITCSMNTGAHGPSNGTCRIRARPLMMRATKLPRKVSPDVLVNLNRVKLLQFFHIK